MAPRKQSIANAQNYGNEPNSRQLIHPAAMVERGIHEQHFLQQMPKDAVRQVKLDCLHCRSNCTISTFRVEGINPHYCPACGTERVV